MNLKFNSYACFKSNIMKKLISLIFLSIAITSCGVLWEYRSINELEGMTWSASDKQIFDFEIKQDGNYEVIIILRHLHGFAMNTIPVHLNMDFMYQEIRNTLQASHLDNQDARVRLSLFRVDGGLYTPTDRSLEYLIEVEALVPYDSSKGLVIDVFHDHLKPSLPLYNIKGANSLVSVLSGIFAKDHKLDEAIILNSESYLCETTASNIFVVKDNIIYTPSISSGLC